MKALQERGTLDWMILTLYILTAFYYFIAGNGDLSLSVAIPSAKFYFIASSVFDILAFDFIGIFLWRKIGGIKSLAFVILVGGLQLTTWAMTYTFALGKESFTLHNLQDPRILLVTITYLTVTPILIKLLWKRVEWKLSWLFVVFPIYYTIYFFVLHGPYIPNSPYNTIWELLYEFFLDLAMVSGFLRLKK